MAGDVYAYASLGRAGLGNMLFPWARCEVLAAERQIPMLAPRWTQPKIGPLLRREKDLRYYAGLFSNENYVRGMQRCRILFCGERVPEHTAGSADLFLTESLKVIVFAGMGSMFRPLLPHRDLVRQRLLKILAPRTRSALAAVRSVDPIAIHVRRGDMMEIVPYGQPYGTGNCGLPLEWFIGCLRSVRDAVGSEVAATVYSDGREEELAPLLSLPRTRLAPRKPSIVDLLLMSRSRILITTGSSTFSAWACFLGKCISLWYPDSSKQIIPSPLPGAVMAALDGSIPDVKTIDWLKEFVDECTRTSDPSYSRTPS